MILVGNQRGGAKDLALHLLKEENERVQVHELRGFVGDNLISALQESYALSRGTRCEQHLYSLSLNPPPEERVEVQVFEKAIDRIEDRLGLKDQPRVIVFHEKEGRRHAHAVWCRIDIENMRAVQLSHDRTKLQDVARELYIEHDWRMPRGFLKKQDRDPLNFSLAEWQQAKRAQKDPKQLKAMFQDCWAASDSKESFAQALKERGFILAKGDRRGHVAVDHTGEAYAVSRWVGLKAKQIRDRLGKPDNLPSAPDALVQAAKLITKRLDELKAEQECEAAALKARHDAQRRLLDHRQRAAVQKLTADQAARQKREEAQRQSKLRTGFLGLWDRLSGKRKRIEAENLEAAAVALMRDERAARDLSVRHDRQRQAQQDEQRKGTALHLSATRELSDDIHRIRDHAHQAQREAERRQHENDKRHRRRNRSRDGLSRRR